mgnify:CR=1 FL=1
MGNIKGITIEIGSDTKKFKSGLKDLNQSAKDLQRELTAVNKALKHDPKNTDLLRQKQELLTKSVSETKSKLDALKAAKEKADKDMASGTEINQEQYRRLVRENFHNRKQSEKSDKGNEKFRQRFRTADCGGRRKDAGCRRKAGGRWKENDAGDCRHYRFGRSCSKTAADFDSSMSQVAAVSVHRG